MVCKQLFSLQSTSDRPFGQSLTVVNVRCLEFDLEVGKREGRSFYHHQLPFYQTSQGELLQRSNISGACEAQLACVTHSPRSKSET